jgi:hypothetical protein
MRAGLNVAMSNDQFNRLVLFEVVERALDNRIAMKIDLAAIVGHDETVVLHREQTTDTALQRYLMSSDIAALLLTALLELAFGRIERIADGDVDVFVGPPNNLSR